MKKRLLPLIIAVAMLVSVCASLSISVSAAANNPYISVPLAADSIEIDGVKGTDYDKAVKIPLERILALSEGYTVPYADIYFMWGADHTIYAYVEVTDDKVVTDSQALIDDFGTDPANLDCVELYFYWGNGEQTIMYKITSDDVLYCFQRAHAGNTPAVDESGVANTRFEAKTKMTDTGYAAEFKIKSNLANLMEGALLSFKAIVASTDDENSGVAVVTNYGNVYSPTRLHLKNGTTAQTYANMMLVGPDDANADWRKYPTVPALDEARFNEDKVEQALDLRSAVLISDTELVITWSKACTLQWFNNTPVFMGVCDKPFPAPVSPYEEGKSWQVGADLSSAVTNDGGVTWKVTLGEPIPTKTGVFRVSETNGADESLYGANNSFIGHVISLDGQDYLNAVNASTDTNPDGWDVTSINFSVDYDYKWDATNEEPIKLISMDIEHGAVQTVQAYFTNPRAEEATEPVTPPPVKPGDDDDEKPTDPEGPTNPEDPTEPDDPTTVPPPTTGDEEGGFPIAIIIAIIVVVIVAVVVVVIVATKKKK